jgi:hypothetical protein
MTAKKNSRPSASIGDAVFKQRARLLSWGAVALLAIVAVAQPPAFAEQQQASAPFKLIVNASNPVTALTKEQAAKLFYKKQRAWPNGDAAVPVDLVEQSPVRQAFSARVLGKDAGAMKGYWQQVIFTGKGVPPIEKASEPEAIAYVAATPGAVAYVAPGTPLPAGVKSVAYQE